MNNSGHSASLAKGALAGLLGGLAASFLMNQFMTGVALVTDGRKRRSADPQRTKQLMTARRKRFQEMADPTGEVSDSIARRVLDRKLTDRERDIAAPVVHYAFGALVGALYGALTEAVPVTRIGKGIPYGVAIWAAGDEVAVPALGLARTPWEQPLEAHAAMFASHVVYGLTLEAVRSRVRNAVA
jgi:putative membrane protein